MAQYKRIGYVQTDRISLVRQNRIDLTPIFHCLCWREQRQSSGTNRRFYFEQGSYWGLMISQALDLMRRAEQTGLFDNPGHDPGKISECIIIDPKDHKYFEMIGRVLVNSGYDREWQNSVAVLCIQSCAKWRKVMILSPGTGKVTFRSLTSDSSYRFAHSEESLDGWKLDKAMLDAHPSAFLHWLEYLKSI